MTTTTTPTSPKTVTDRVEADLARQRAAPTTPPAKPGNGTAKPAAAPPPPAAAPQLIALKRIAPAPWNERKMHNRTKDAETFASVKEHGVLQSILVRPRHDGYEVVAGSTRYAAAKAAGQTEIPCLIRQLTDQEVVELQLEENGKRDDVHPLDEADALRRLHEEFHVSPEEIGTRVGKGRTWVYSRIQLCKLGAPARTAFLKGKLDASAALLLARITDPEQQKKATADLTRVDQYSGAPMSYRKAAEYVQTNYMLKLDGCGFAIADAQLVPTAGPCSSCAKRTGNQRELFSDVKSPDVCTDVKCFKAKQEATWVQRAAAAEAAGQAVLPAEQAKRVFDSYGHDEVSDRAAYVDLDAKEWVGSKQQPWRQILGKAAPAATLARDPKGKVHELVPRAAVAAVLKEKGKKVGYGEFGDAPGRGLDAREKRAREEQKRRYEIARLTLAAVATAAAKAPVTLAFWRFLLEGFLEGSWRDTLVDVIKRRQLESIKQRNCNSLDTGATLRRAAAAATEPELRALIVEIIASRFACSTYSNEPGQLLVKACELLGLDRKQLAADARGAIGGKAKAVPPAKAKPATAPTKKAAAQGSKKGRRP